MNPVRGAEIDLYIKNSLGKPQLVASFSTLEQVKDYLRKNDPNAYWCAVGKQVIAGSR